MLTDPDRKEWAHFWTQILRYSCYKDEVAKKKKKKKKGGKKNLFELNMAFKFYQS